MSSVIRKYEIRRRQRRHAALRKWKAKLSKASGPAQTALILQKLKKICPWVESSQWQKIAEQSRVRKAA